MNQNVPFTLVCVAVLAFACGPRPRGEASNERAPHTTRSAPANADTPLAPSLAIQVEKGVRFQFEIANASAKKLELIFADGRTHDVVVLDSIGREVWRSSEGRLFTQAVQNKVLRASDSLRYRERWDAPRPGSYTAVATLASTNFPVEHRVAFTVR